MLSACLTDAFSRVIQKFSNQKWLSHRMHRLAERRKAAPSFGGEDGLGINEIYVYIYTLIHAVATCCAQHSHMTSWTIYIRLGVVHSFMYAVYLYQPSRTERIPLRHTPHIRWDFYGLAGNWYGLAICRSCTPSTLSCQMS